MTRPPPQRTIVLTGAAGGIGRSLAIGLLADGHRVVLLDRQQEDLDDLTSTLSPQVRDRSACLAVDLSDPLEVDSAIQDIRDLVPRVDVLVNNAGIGPGAIRGDYLQHAIRAEEVSTRVLRDTFEVNAIAPMVLSLAFLPDMIRSDLGRIINITTGLDSMMLPGYLGYGGTKASLEAHSAILAKELEGTGVSVSVLVPGAIVDTAIVPHDSIRDREGLEAPSIMLAPVLWLVGPAGQEANGRRIQAIEFADRIPLGGHRFDPIGWPAKQRYHIPR